MPIYEFKRDGITRISETSFSQVGVHERRDLQRLLRDQIDVISPDTLIISEEFGDWEDSKRRVDLLGLDREAKLVVVELKRTEDGGHMELQSIRYAAMVSTMTFGEVVEIYNAYLASKGPSEVDARSKILEFLEWDEPDEDAFAQDVRIILVSAEFSKEVTSAVMWLNDQGLDIQCFRLKPYNLDGRLLVDVQQLIPLPEAAAYQFKRREKDRTERQARAGGPDFTRFDLEMEGKAYGAMWKRNAIFAICQRLCREGVSPEEIALLFDWRPNRVWLPLEGEVDAKEFELAASEKTGVKGQGKRWFCSEDQLVQFGGKTYAFSNQWGGQNWHRAMKILQEKYPQYGIKFAPAS